MQKPHALIISDYNPKTHVFHYEFTCPVYEENEDAPCALATQCEKCDEEPDPETTESFINHGQEHKYIGGEWLIRDENACAVRDYPEIVDDSSVEGIALSHGNGTYAVEVSVSPSFNPAPGILTLFPVSNRRNVATTWLELYCLKTPLQLNPRIIHRIEHAIA